MKEMGTYSFAPSYTVVVPDLLSVVDRVAEFAKKTVAICDGREQSNNQVCLREQEAIFSLATADLQAIACESLNETEYLITTLSQSIADCKMNRQDGCACSWKPTTAVPLRIQLYGDSPWIYVDEIAVHPKPLGAQKAKFKLDANSVTRDVAIDLIKNNSGMFLHVAELNTGKSIYAEDRAVTQFSMIKENGQLVWVADAQNTPICGEYKTMHHVCIGLKKPIPHLAKGTFENPVLKFALTLNDAYAPQKLSDLSLARAQLGLQTYTITFTASQSKDISRYNIWCAVDDFKENPDYVALPWSGMAQDALIQVDIAYVCKPYVHGQKYKIKAAPVDISGNIGEAAIFDMTVEEIKETVVIT